MNNSLSTAEIVLLVGRRMRAFGSIATELGKDHPVTRMMDSLAWGRHGAEWGGEGPKLKTATYALGFLDGFFDSINTWARDNDQKAQRVMLKFYKADFCAKEGGA